MSFTVSQVEFLDANAEFVEYRRLFELTLLGETFRLAESEYEVTTSDGKVWQPAISLISAPGIQRTDGFDAIPVEYVVAGLAQDPDADAVAAFSAMAIAVLQNPDSYFGGTVHQWMQLLVNRSAVGPAISIHRGWIREVKVNESVSQASFTVTVESILARRERTPLGQYTDRDQKRRSPGDRGCEFTPTFADKVIKGWPI